MLEEIVLSETKHALGSRCNVFNYQFIGGEIDMVVYDKKENTCRLYEIKHGTVPVKDQCRHLLNGQECERLRDVYGPIVKKAVIYRGAARRAEWGIDYLNAAEFLADIEGNVLREGDLPGGPRG